MAAELGHGLLAGTQPDHTPAVLLLEIGLDETADRVVILDEEQDSSGRRRGHDLLI